MTEPSLATVERNPSASVHRIFWQGIAPMALVVWFWWHESMWGFNPTDDGFVLAQSWRVLHGEVPHVDFTTPRPAGSALLHLPVVVLPEAMWAVSRFMVTLQHLVVAMAAVSVLTRGSTAPAAARFGLVATAFLLDINTWPIMAWHTLDGLTLSLGAYWIADRSGSGRSRQHLVGWATAFLLAGLAILTKQGFLVTPIILIGLIGLRRAWRVLPLALLSAVAPAAYAVWTRAAPGGVMAQLHTGSGTELWAPVLVLQRVLLSPPGLGMLGCAALAVALTWWRRIPYSLILTCGLLTAPILAAAYRWRLYLLADWVYLPIISLLVVGCLVARMATTLYHVLAIALLGLAVSVSWGVSSPSLLAGVCLAGAGALVFRTFERQPHAGRQFAVGALATAIACCTLSIEIREDYVYRERSRGELTSVRDGGQLMGLHVSPQTDAYIAVVEECVRRHPATRVAVLPDGPGLYPLLGVRNPFPWDWWLTLERTAETDRLIGETVDRLNAEGDYLVVVQSFDLEVLSTTPVSDVRRPGPQFFHPPGYSAALQRLSGERVTCGSLTGWFAPPPR